jgi:hypothetical protein
MEPITVDVALEERIVFARREARLYREKTIAVEAANGFEIPGERLTAACIERGDEPLRGLSVISLICSDFMSVLLCGDLVPSPSAGEPKNRVHRRAEGA